MKPFQTLQIARFVQSTTFERLELSTIEQLKKHLLDSTGSLLFATGAITIHKLVEQIVNMGEGGKCKVPLAGVIAADRAAQLFTALIRYPDFMDNFLGKESTCHPSDNIGALLAACQLVDCSGKDLLVAMAIGYEVECRLVEEIPVMMKGFDHTLLLAYSVTAALCKLLNLDEIQTANALGMAGCSFNPLVTCRASYTYEWKGLASSLVNMGCMNIVFLAKQGLTGPISIFEGPKGFSEIYGMKLKYDWSREDFSLIKKCSLKSYNAEVHTQSAIEAALYLRSNNDFATENIESIEVITFLTSYHIVGSGAYGQRKEVHSKEQADHSLPYVLSVALLDGRVYPEQLMPDRINRDDVQQLLQKVTVRTSSPLHKPFLLAGLLDPFTEAYPDKLIACVEITFFNGKKIKAEKKSYKGYYTDPMSWKETAVKFSNLTADFPRTVQQTCIELIGNLENEHPGTLTGLLADACKPVESY